MPASEIIDRNRAQTRFCQDLCPMTADVAGTVGDQDMHFGKAPWWEDQVVAAIP